MNDAGQRTIVVMVENEMDIDSVSVQNSLNCSWSVDSLFKDEVHANLANLMPAREIIESFAALTYRNINGIQIPCFDGEKPTILFWKLGELNVDQLQKECLNRNLTVIIGASGSGKTRQTFEVLCKVYGVHFTMSDSRIPGSLDFSIMIKKLGEHLVVNSPVANQKYLNRFMKCLIGARLFLFKHCYDLKRITQQEWLLMQLRYDCSKIIHEFHKFNKRDLDNQIQSLIQFMLDLNKCGNFIPVFIDEAQATIGLYKDHFHSTKGEQSKSLYFGLAVAVTSITRCSFISCGTSLRLGDANELLSRASKSDTDIRHIISESFDDVESINRYIQSIQPQYSLEDGYSRYFIGRVRFLASFVEYQIRNNCNVPAVDYIEAVTTDTENELTLGNLFRRDRFEGLGHLDYVTCMQLLKESVLHFIYYGMPLNVTSKEAWFFEMSFGRLVKFGLDLYILIDEPLLLATANNLLLKRDTNEQYSKVPIVALKEYFESRLCKTTHPSSRGLTWENYLSVRLLEIAQTDYRVFFWEAWPRLTH
jgi:hypothetical protein